MAPESDGGTSPNQYAPPKSRVADVSTAGPVEKADRSKRLAAVLVDGVIFLVAWLPALVSMGPALMAGWRGASRADVSAMMSAAAGLWFSVSGILSLVLLLITANFVRKNGQTIGKKIIGIKVVRSDGSKATLGRIFWLRNFVSSLPGAIPFLGNFWGLIDALMIFRDSKKCLHDNIADTIVINA
jgi:uncharacterized RDD family membrane protein YckC